MGGLLPAVSIHSRLYRREPLIFNSYFVHQISLAIFHNYGIVSAAAAVNLAAGCSNKQHHIDIYYEEDCYPGPYRRCFRFLPAAAAADSRPRARSRSGSRGSCKGQVSIPERKFLSLSY